MLLPAARRLAERYFGLTGVVQRIREVRKGGHRSLPAAAASFCVAATGACKLDVIGGERASVLLMLASRSTDEPACCLPEPAHRPIHPTHCRGGGQVRHAWQYNVPPCPQLYLYSKAGERWRCALQRLRDWLSANVGTVVSLPVSASLSLQPVSAACLPACLPR